MQVGKRFILHNVEHMYDIAPVEFLAVTSNTPSSPLINPVRGRLSAGAWSCASDVRGNAEYFRSDVGWRKATCRRLTGTCGVYQRAASLIQLSHLPNIPQCEAERIIALRARGWNGTAVVNSNGDKSRPNRVEP